jgi:putative transcriptional regulator
MIDDFDPDNPPLTDTDLAAMARPPLARRVRRRLGMNQQAFADRYGIPLRTLQEWEQGRREPDATATSYLTAIGHDPEGVARALAAGRAA